MRHAIVFALSLIATSAVWSQGAGGGHTPVDNGGGATGGTGIQTAGPAAVQCKANLAALATDKLRAMLLTEKAVTKQVMDNATITEAKLGAACEQTCAVYDTTVSGIHTAHMQPALSSTSPGYYEQLAYLNMTMPVLPGKADLEKCLPVFVTAQWCPASGNGIGAEPGTRQKNPLDGLSVCISQVAALAEMQNFDLDFVKHCKRPAIVDAADRIKAEKVCVANAISAKAARDAMNKAAEDAAAKAAEKAAAVYVGPLVGSNPVGATAKGGARTKP